MHIYKNCEMHIWPLGRPSGVCRSIGSVEHTQCNNCLAMRIRFLTDVNVDGKWLTVEQEQIIEPVFDISQAK